MRYGVRRGAIVAVLALALAGCSAPSPSVPDPTPVDPAATGTAAPPVVPAPLDRIAFTRWSGTGDAQPSLWTGNIDGTDLRPVGTQSAEYPDWSPDRSHLIFDYVTDDGSRQIATIRLDGTGLVQLTDTANNEAADYSPDAASIVFDRYVVPEADPEFTTELWVMDADGSNQRPLLGEGDGGFDYEGEYSPDGSRIVFARYDPVADATAAFVVGSDGTGIRRISPFIEYLEHPRWSPDGTTIIYNVEYLRDLDDARNGIWTVAAEGGEPELVLAGSAELHPFKPDYSPDGTRILFSGLLRDEGVEELHVMDADGSNLVRLTHEGTYLNHPIWD